MKLQKIYCHSYIFQAFVRWATILHGEKKSSKQEPDLLFSLSGGEKGPQLTGQAADPFAPGLLLQSLNRLPTRDLGCVFRIDPGTFSGKLIRQGAQEILFIPGNGFSLGWVGATAFSFGERPRKHAWTEFAGDGGDGRGWRMDGTDR